MGGRRESARASTRETRRGARGEEEGAFPLFYIFFELNKLIRSRSNPMGCLSSKDASILKAKKWKSQEPVTLEELQKRREEFWDTAPHYGGDPVIWEALKVAVADLESAKVILEAADVIIAEPDLSVVYDQKGRKYEIPIFCLSEPINLIRE